MSADGPLLRTTGLACERGGRRVLCGVDVEVPRACVTALVGPSGSGKSSLLRCLVRFEEPAAGAVLLDGDDVRELDACVLRRRVGLLAQAPVMLPGTVRENVAYGLDDVDAGDALGRVGLPPALLDRDAGGLSGGEAARVAIARALAREPEALLLDEPTSALDAAAAAVVEALLVTLAADGLAILVVTHDEAQARRVARRAVRLIAGDVAAAGPAVEVL